MRRSNDLVEISRRQLCGGLASCFGLAALASCSGGSGAQPDAPTPPQDAPGGGCATGATDVGAPTTFAANTPMYFSSGNFFVVRDSNGLYAVSARCTHQGVTIVVDSPNMDFYCPGHGATFDYNGNATGAPAFTPLLHYAMCMLANGHVGVNTSQSAPQSQRLNA